MYNSSKWSLKTCKRQFVLLRIVIWSVLYCNAKCYPKGCGSFIISIICTIGFYVWLLYLLWFLFTHINNTCKMYMIYEFCRRLRWRRSYYFRSFFSCLQQSYVKGVHLGPQRGFRRPRVGIVDEIKWWDCSNVVFTNKRTIFSTFDPLLLSSRRIFP